ncbi:MAG: hypothetical protein K0S09_1615 [Sphingobacteriaceae bacterium]|jgi:hypothetical protein|nr:hypothetical protein [Sphingobacteriaceae bacterium]
MNLFRKHSQHVSKLHLPPEKIIALKKEKQL